MNAYTEPQKLALREIETSMEEEQRIISENDPMVHGYGPRGPGDPGPSYLAFLAAKAKLRRLSAAKAHLMVAWKRTP